MNLVQYLLVLLIAAPSLVFVIAAFIGERRTRRYQREPLTPSVEIVARKRAAELPPMIARR